MLYTVKYNDEIIARGLSLDDAMDLVESMIHKGSEYTIQISAEEENEHD